jgi:VanZ family protein
MLKAPSFIPALVCLVVITILSVIPNMQLPKFDLFATDKLGHTLAYAGLCFLTLWGWSRSRADRALTRQQTLQVLAFAAGYGILMELVQFAFIPGRFCDIDDMIANAVGAIFGWLGFWIYERQTFINF